MRVTFLGVGAALPAPGQTNCSYLIEAGGAVVLFDCGPCVLQQFAAAGRSPGEVTHVFVSHAHGDHALGWPMFVLWWALERAKGSEAHRREGEARHREGEAPAEPGRAASHGGDRPGSVIAAARQEPRPPGSDRRHLPQVVASEVTRGHLRALWEHSYNDAPALEMPFTELPSDRPSSLRLTEGLTLATWPMPHSLTSPVLSGRFEAGGKVLALTADTARSENVVELARGADLVVHDARYAASLRPEGDIQSRFHCSARDAGEYAAAAGAKRLALVHVGAELVGREAELIAEAKARYQGPVFVPKGGDIAEV